MSDVALRVENLSKRYLIGRVKDRYDTLREQIAQGLRSVFHPNGQHGEPPEIWALKDVSFEVKQGEVLGIIGRNGAGKSTLLKILSRITEPTAGRATIYGRVSSLLEVGTGFQPDLSGRENIYLNGAILGMRKAEIDGKFDEIVAFAEIGKFLDTPVKRYSSGMYVRLAFAVAAYLKPDILVIDEVLAVGDVAFQNKCLGKMGATAREGRTVLFVSHNMGAIANLCNSALWLDAGTIAAHGDVASTINSYLKGASAIVEASSPSSRIETKDVRVLDVRVRDSNGEECSTFGMGATIVVEFSVEFFRPFSSVDLALEVKRTATGLHVLHMVNQDCGFLIEKIAAGRRWFRVEIPDCTLYPAVYKISVWVGRGSTTLEHIPDAATFTMVQSGVSMRTTPLSYHSEAVFYVASKWTEV